MCGGDGCLLRLLVERMFLARSAELVHLESVFENFFVLPAVVPDFLAHRALQFYQIILRHKTALIF